MFSRFTASSRLVMQRAFREAKRSQHDFVGTEHLLFGILCDTEGLAATLLRSLNAQPELILEKVELALRRHDAGMAMEQFPLSPASKRVFRCAADESALLQNHGIGPEHLLLGLVRESDCEAAQLLSRHGVTLGAIRTAAAQIPPDAQREAQIQLSDTPQLTLGENPTVDELERWIAPVIKLETSSAFLRSTSAAPTTAEELQAVQGQLRLTQLLLGCLLSYAFGHLMFNWWAGLLLVPLGMLIVGTHSTPVGISFGMACGYFLGSASRLDLLGSAYDTIILAIVGGFLGSFLGDGWRFAKTIQQTPQSGSDQPEQESPHDITENRAK